MHVKLYIHKQVIEKKKHSASVKVSPLIIAIIVEVQGYLIIAKQRFALNSTDAIETSYFPSAWKSVSRPKIIVYYFTTM